MVLYCCSGWSLEFTTQFILWNELVIDILWLSYSMISFVFYINNIADPYYEFRYGFYILWSIIGTLMAILGLYAVKKSKPSFLSGFLYYLYYYVLFECFSLLFLIINPALYMDIFHRSIRKLHFLIELNTTEVKNVIWTIAWYFLLISNLIYFAKIVKSYRDEKQVIRNTSNDTFEAFELSLMTKLFGSKMKTSLRRTTTV